jgi:membrane fusion protein
MLTERDFVMATPDTPPLFRIEAIQHASGSLYGTIILARPVSYGILTGLFTLMAVAVIAFLVFFNYTSSAIIQGVVVPTKGSLRVIPSQPGIVSQVMVREGSQVKRGDILFVLTSERSTLDTRESEQAIANLMQERRTSFERERDSQREQNIQHIAVAQRRVAEIKAQLRHIDSQIALQRRRVALSEETVKRNNELQAASFISRASVQEKVGELLDQQQRLGDLERSRLELARDTATAEDQIADLRIRMKLNEESAARSIASLTQELTEIDARRQLTVRATQAGSITAITAQVGQSVTASQALATILPSASALEVELYAPSRTVGFVKAGMPVLIRYQAYPFQNYGQYAGTVKEITSTVLAPSEVNPGAGAVNAAVDSTQGPVYRIRVALARQSVTVQGVEQQLRPGMALDASVQLEKRPLYQWILGPVTSLIEKV